MTSTITPPTLAPVAPSFAPATRQAYAAALRAAWDARPEIRASVTDYRDPADLHHSVRPFLSGDGASGYMLAWTSNGLELIGVFSTVRGRGDELVRDAVR